MVHMPSSSSDVKTLDLQGGITTVQLLGYTRGIGTQERKQSTTQQTMSAAEKGVAEWLMHCSQSRRVEGWNPSLDSNRVPHPTF